MSGPRRGFQTSEFWLSFFAILVGAALSGGFFEESSTTFKILSFVATALTALGYSAARAFVKGAEAKKDALKAAAGASEAGKP